ncbi:MAG: SAM-dependent DNA methyltransferase [Deltaproteobacteria bacterium]|nr:SAM-dependent DNA methyltransferase [Deltaproteobacteria bacterium]
MLDKETKQRINSARQILVGKVPDPKAQVEQITNALIYKFMDDMDRENEELGGKAQFLTGDLKEFSWGRLMSRELSGLERWDIYTRALSSFAKSKQIPELFRTIFKDAYLPYRDPETLNLFLKEINGFSYSNSENLGNAFEYLLSILGSQGDAGQFRTPRHIIDFIVEVVNPQKTNRILDPACGTAGFLISSYKHIWRENSSNFKADEYIPTFAETESADISTVEIQKNGKFKGDKLTPDNRKRLGRNIVGYDISPDMVRLSLVNLYLHNFSTPQVYDNVIQNNMIFQLNYFKQLYLMNI